MEDKPTSVATFTRTVSKPREGERSRPFETSSTNDANYIDRFNATLERMICDSSAAVLCVSPERSEP